MAEPTEPKSRIEQWRERQKMDPSTLTPEELEEAGQTLILEDHIADVATYNLIKMAGDPSNESLISTIIGVSAEMAARAIFMGYIGQDPKSGQFTIDDSMEVFMDTIKTRLEKQAIEYGYNQEKH